MSEPTRTEPGPSVSGSHAATSPAKRIAAIDVGSNSIRQIVADVSPTGGIRVVDEMKAAPRLGAGLDRSGELAPAAMRAATEALGRMSTLARQLGSERIEAVATSAVRDASNGAQFLALVRAETGLDVRLLDGDEEARLSYLSALAHFEMGEGRWAVMDIGGGSLEIALSADGLLDQLLSFPFGAVRLTEQFLSGGARRRDVVRLRRHVRAALREVIPRGEWRGAQVIGSGGTFTNLASVHLARRGQSVPTVHGTVVRRGDVEHILTALEEMTAAERLAVPGLSPARADIIVAGLAVAAEVLARLDAREVIASAYGIREGLLLDAARVTPSAGDPGEARARSVREFAERSRYEEPHSRHVQRLALEIFDAIAAKLGAEPADRQILSDAALLHDVGYAINYSRHHKHTYHLIFHAALVGVPPVEQAVIANVARYHRGAAPRPKHRGFAALGRAERRQVTRLAAVLRVADGLDRGHIGAVQSVGVEVTKRAVRLTPVGRPDAPSLRLELWGASRKSELLSEVLDMPVEVLTPDGRVVRYDEDGAAVG